MLQQPILSWPLLTSNPARYSSLKRREGRPRKLAVCLGAGQCTMAGASWQVGSHGPKGEELPGQGLCCTQIPLVQSTTGHQVARQAGNRGGTHQVGQRLHGVAVANDVQRGRRAHGLVKPLQLRVAHPTRGTRRERWFCMRQEGQHCSAGPLRRHRAGETGRRIASSWAFLLARSGQAQLKVNSTQGPALPCHSQKLLRPPAAVHLIPAKAMMNRSGGNPLSAKPLRCMPTAKLAIAPPCGLGRQSKYGTQRPHVGRARACR